MTGQVKHIAHALGWKAVCTRPDLCRVGKDIVAFNSHATLDQKVVVSPDVKAQGTAVYREGDLFKNVQADAGAHLVSGTSLATGHVKILEGHSNVKVNGKPVARHDSRCLINCNAAGEGGAEGKLVTEEKAGTGHTDVASDSSVPPGERSSPRLEKLKAARDKLEADQLDLNALDEYVDFGRTNAALDEVIGEIQGKPGTVGDVFAQGARGLLGFGKDIVTGVGELAYEGIKGVPKLARSRFTTSGQAIGQLDAQIFAENIRLGNITAGTVSDGALNLGSALVKPITDPWGKGQYVESVTRGAAEVFTLPTGWTKAGRAAKAAKAADALKLAEAAKAAEAAEAVKLMEAAKAAEGARAAEAARTAAAQVAEAGEITSKAPAAGKASKTPKAKGHGSGVHVKKKAKKKKKGPKEKKPNKPRQPQEYESRVINEDGSVTYTLKTKEGELFDVTYRDGYPDFTDFKYDGPLGKSEVEIDMLGENRPDFIEANKKAGFGDKAYSHPDDYIWHHHEDMKTMQLIRKDIHNAVPHTGGASGARHRGKP